MKHKAVLYLSKHWQADHPVLVRWKDYYESRGVRFIPFHVEWNLYYADRKRKIKQLLRVLSTCLRNNAWLLHANDPESGLLCHHINRLFRIPFIFDAHEVFSHEYPLSIEGQFYKNHKQQAEQLMLPTASMVIVPNQQRIDFFKALYPNLGYVNYVLLENKSWTGADRPCQITASKPAADRIKVFYGGTFWMGRKQESFPELSMALSQNGMQLVLSGGSNDYLQQLLQNGESCYVGNIAVEEYVDFVRQIDIALAWYFPTTINDELCAPLKIFDYLAAGKPILAANLPYLAELSERFPGVIHLFEPGNWQDCFSKAQMIAANYAHYAALASQVLTSAISWEGQYSFLDQEFKKAGL